MPDVYTWIAWAVAALALVAGSQLLGVTGLLALLLLALLALTTLGFVSAQRARQADGRRNPRFEPTDEIFRAPGGDEVVRVYVDPKTGERRYWKLK
ncbi:MAG TPA: hypothetical protein VIK06_08560 [Candidatus Limnocylindrales bacterium]